MLGCQSQPVYRPAPVVTPLPEKQADTSGKVPPALVIEEHKRVAKVKALPSYGDGKIQRQSMPNTMPNNTPNATASASNIPLPHPAQPKVLLRDGTNIPAFNNLLTRAQQQIQANQLNAAEQTLIQAQRMAPQSAAVYAYLSQVALKKKQASNAEAMARKGLMLTSNPRQQHAFWQLILAAAELQNNASLAAQARDQMQQLSGQF